MTGRPFAGFGGSACSIAALVCCLSLATPALAQEAPIEGDVVQDQPAPAPTPGPSPSPTPAIVPQGTPETPATTAPSQDRTPPPEPPAGTPPPGFEDLEDRIDTAFDVSVLGRRIGSFRATLENGMIRFESPEAIADALSGVVEREAVIALLSRPLPANEQYRCFTGQTIGCGLLPPGEQGLIANPERFSVEIFFSPAAVLQVRERRLTLGPSSSQGFSLIQNVVASVATSGLDFSEIEFGGALDTQASVGSTSFLAQTYFGTGFGARVNQGLVQHVWSNRIARGGLIEDFNTNLIANYRMFGAEFGSFYPTLAYEGEQIGTPIDIVLPRDADVEIRRNGVLLSTRRYGAGPQRLDTSGLPNGSYQVQVVARVDGAIVLDETRSFSRSGALPIRGETEFSVRAGLFVEDRFAAADVDRSGFFPGLRQSAVIGGRVARRISSTVALEGNLLFVDDQLIGETTVRGFFGPIEGAATVAASDDGSWGASVTGSTVLWGVRFNLAARTVDTDARFGPNDREFGRYRPFFRREQSVIASAQFSVLGGSMGIAGSYSTSRDTRDRYAISARYSRQVRAFGRPGFVTGFALVSDVETRVGATLSMTFAVDDRMSLSTSAGAEYVPSSNGSTREGLSPVAAAALSRRDRIGRVDLLSRANVSTSADGERAGIGVIAESPVGIADLNGQYVRNRTGQFTSVIGNLQSGFAYGGGRFKWGLARPGEAVILTDLDIDTVDSAARNSDSGYRVRVDTQSFDLLRPGGLSAIGVPAYDEYEVTLVPENAPPYDVRIEPRTVVLYPGNVVRLRYAAQRDVTIFGQLVDESGASISRARLRGGSDFTLSDASGYFTITLPIGDAIEIARNADGGACAPVAVRTLVPEGAPRDLYRVGQLICRPAAE